jgi:hypothetical protein
MSSGRFVKIRVSRQWYVLRADSSVSGMQMGPVAELRNML